MKLRLLILCLGCKACAFLPSEPSPVEDSEPVAQPAGITDLLQPRRSLPDLLVERLRLCQHDEPKRQALLSHYQKLSEVAEESARTVDENKLNALLLATCEPARTPGVLNALLAEVTGAGTWPEDYAAFFDLLISNQRAYAAVEKVYMDLEQAYGDLKQEHEKTIQGLSDIESDIDLQTNGNAEAAETAPADGDGEAETDRPMTGTLP